MPFTETIKKTVRKLSDQRCCVCHHIQIGVDIHHIVPVSDDGPDTIDNAAPLCPNCHRLYGAIRERGHMSVNVEITEMLRLTSKLYRRVSQ